MRNNNALDQDIKNPTSTASSIYSRSLLKQLADAYKGSAYRTIQSKAKKKHYVTRKMHDLLKICVIKYNAKNVLR